MTRISRRGFVTAVAGSLPVVAMPACERDESGLPVRSIEAGPLRALAEVTLPAELGDAGLERAVEDFTRWLVAYRPVAERNHGYGTGEIQYTGPDPLPGWRAQLQALDIEARQRFGRSFAELDAGPRGGLVRASLRRERGPLPDPVDAHHVAVALLAWWAARPEATDLCYRARIGKETCRPLDSAADRPPPLAGS